MSPAPQAPPTLLAELLASTHSISVRRFCRTARVTVFRERRLVRWGVLSFLIPLAEVNSAVAELKAAYRINGVTVIDANA